MEIVIQRKPDEVLSIVENAVNSGKYDYKGFIGIHYKFGIINHSEKTFFRLYIFLY